MLINIGTRTAPQRPLDGIELFEECHGRIRTFTDLARRLAEDRDGEPLLRAEAARAVHRYFSIALPLHALDEDASLMPRLLPFADKHLRDAIVSMADQHGDIDMALADLLPLWGDAATAGGILPRFVRRETEALDLLLTVHLDLEEEIVFPAARRFLSRERLVEIASEIRERRHVFEQRPLTPPSGAHS